jgi:hypothetical protein
MTLKKKADVGTGQLCRLPRLRVKGRDEKGTGQLFCEADLRSLGLGTG